MAMDFANTHRFDYNGWPAMILVPQIVWAWPFIKLFGFSFLITRLTALLEPARDTSACTLSGPSQWIAARLRCLRHPVDHALTAHAAVGDLLHVGCACVRCFRPLCLYAGELCLAGRRTESLRGVGRPLRVFRSSQWSRPPDLLDSAALVSPRNRRDSAPEENCRHRSHGRVADNDPGCGPSGCMVTCRSPWQWPAPGLLTRISPLSEWPSLFCIWQKTVGSTAGDSGMYMGVLLFPLLACSSGFRSL